VIGSDIVHSYLGSEGDAKAHRNFYMQFFGAKPIKSPVANSAVPGVVLYSAVSTQGPRQSNKGGALDGIGFEVKNLEAFSRKLQAAGMKFTQPYSKTRYKTFAHAEFTDPWGTPVQLTEGLNRYVSKAARQPAQEQRQTAALTGAAHGKQVFETYCSYCHTVESTAIQYGDAPGLKGLFGWPPHKLRDGSEHKEHTETILRQVITLGTDRTGGRMPPAGFYLSSQELDDVMAYLRTL